MRAGLFEEVCSSFRKEIEGQVEWQQRVVECTEQVVAYECTSGSYEWWRVMVRAYEWWFIMSRLVAPYELLHVRVMKNKKV